MHLFDKAAYQIREALSEASPGQRLVQLGDLGGYNHKPGLMNAVSQLTRTLLADVNSLHQIRCNTLRLL